jgi:hypothetical protein
MCGWRSELRIACCMTRFIKTRCGCEIIRKILYLANSKKKQRSTYKRFEGHVKAARFMDQSEDAVDFALAEEVLVVTQRKPK